MSPRYALPLLLLLSACGDDAKGGADLAVADLAMPAVDFAGVDLFGVDLAVADLAVADLAKDPTYPAGPYGNTVGAIIPPLVWEGYADPLADAIATSKTYGTYSMNDLRLSGSKFGIVHVSAFF